VACGYSQVGGQDFDDIFSPVVNDVSFRIWLILTMIWKLHSIVFDIEVAFLNGDLEHEMFMDCPAGMDHADNECLLLQKTIYGLTQSARMFFMKLSKILKDIGFVQSKSDQCLFVRRNGLGIVLLIVYVDDCAASGSKAALKQMLEEIKKADLTFTVEENLRDYLSCEIVFNKDKSKAWLGQPHMVKKIKKTFAETVAKLPKYKTPGTPGVGLVRAKEGEQVATAEEHSIYRSGVGMLLYLVKHSRPDIANAVRELTKCLIGPHPAAMKEMYRVIKFVLDTQSIGLRIEPKMKEKQVLFLLRGYCDSDWAGDKDNRKSVSGFVLFFCGVLIMWRSRQQVSVALSSAEAEFVSVGELAKEICFVVQILLSIGVPVQMPVTIYVDNMGAIFMSRNASSSTRTRHMDVKWRFLNDLTDGEVVELIFVKSADNRSDMKTKNVSGDIYSRHSPEFVAEKAAAWETED
jgi:hypothetical protein